MALVERQGSGDRKVDGNTIAGAPFIIIFFMREKKKACNYIISVVL